MKKKILITCDTEALDFPIFDKSPDINIFGRISNSEEYGIQKIMDTVDKINKKVLFFYDISTEYSYPGITSKVKDLINTAGHDLEMHAHLEHLSDEIWKKKGYKRPTFAVNYFDNEASMTYLEPLVDLFTKYIKHPTAFRAGSWRYSSGIINALGKLNIPFSFNYYPETTHRLNYPHGVDAGPLGIFKWCNGVIEVPTGILTGPNIFSNSQKYFGFESHRLRSFRDYHDFIKTSIKQDPVNQILILVMHSWSFLNKYDKTNVAVDHELFNAFEEFIITSSDEYEIISFDELRNDINFSELMEVPTNFSGYGNSKLLAL